MAGHTGQYVIYRCKGGQCREKYFRGAERFCAEKLYKHLSKNEL